jgi:hypothetical protein
VYSAEPSIRPASGGQLPSFKDILRRVALAGRWLTDREASPAVTINESFARAVFGKADPLGRRMRIPDSCRTDEPLATIVELVADMRYARLDEQPAPETYAPYRQAIYVRSMDIMVRTAGDPGPDPP